MEQLFCAEHEKWLTAFNLEAPVELLVFPRWLRGRWTVTARPVGCFGTSWSGAVSRFSAPTGCSTGSGRARVRTEFLNLLKVRLTDPHLRGARARCSANS